MTRENGESMGNADRLALTPIEVAERLGVGRSTVYALLATGEMPSFLIGKSRRVSVEQLKVWMDHQIQQARERNAWSR